MKGKTDGFIIITKTGGSTITAPWSQIDVAGSILSDEWEIALPHPVEVHTDQFSLAANDSIRIGRNVEINDLQNIRNSLADASDTLTVDFVLRKSIDSSVVAIVEHSYITKDTIIAPGYGLDASTTKYKYPTGSTTLDSAFITLEIKRTKIDSLTSNFVEYEGSDSLPISSYKHSSPQIQKVQPEISVSIIPNPLSLSASVVVKLPDEGMTSIELYDIQGRKIQTLYSKIGSGELHLMLDGSTLSSGIYLLRIQQGSSVATRKVELVK